MAINQSKKKGIFKEKVPKPPKAKITKVKKPVNKAFTAKTQVVVVEDPAVIIDREINALKKQKEETALLEAELEKPFADRNPTLMRKYGYVDGVSKIDAYPDLTPDQKYHIKIHLPEDPKIDRNLRANPWYIKIGVKYEGNEFTFRFPYARSNVSEDETVYQIDNFPVWVDTKGQVINDLSEYTLFQALYDFSHDVRGNDAAIRNVFIEYGIVNRDNDELDFRIYGKGYGVTFTKIKQSAAPKKKKSQASTVKEQFNDFDLDFDGSWVYYHTLNTAEEAVEKVENNPQYRHFVGVPDGVTFTGPYELYLDHVITGKSHIKDSYYCMLTSWDKKLNAYGFAIINGILAITTVVPSIKKTREAAELFIKSTNERIYQASIIGTESVHDIIPTKGVRKK